MVLAAVAKPQLVFVMSATVVALRQTTGLLLAQVILLLNQHVVSVAQLVRVLSQTAVAVAHLLLVLGQSVLHLHSSMFVDVSVNEREELLRPCYRVNSEIASDQSRKKNADEVHISASFVGVSLKYGSDH